VARAVGLDVHLEFCEVAIAEGGAVRSVGRVETKPEQLELFAQSLGPDDRVALEVTGNAWEIARIVEPHVARVVVVSPSDTGIRQARAKTDRLDARTLARLLASGELDAVWMPDRATWVMRRRLARRGQLVWTRSRVKNEIHAVLMRCLVGRAPFADLFGVKGRRWLAELELPVEERETVDAGMRQVEFLDAEIAAVERLIARDALNSPQIKRLMTVPGVNVIVAASFVAAVGDIHRFEDPRKLVGYLGLDPRVRQSGSGPASHGRISKQGSVRARHAGPLHAFYQRVRARRGHFVAIVACARKLACLFWVLLTREEDYAFAQPSLTRKKIRLLELTAGAQRHAPEGRRGLVCQPGRSPSRARARSPGRGRLPAHRPRLPRHPGHQDGRGRDTGTRTFRPSKRQAARQGHSPTPCALARRRPRPPTLSQRSAPNSKRP
jgi:transposase